MREGEHGWLEIRVRALLKMYGSESSCFQKMRLRSTLGSHCEIRWQPNALQYCIPGYSEHEHVETKIPLHGYEVDTLIDQNWAMINLQILYCMRKGYELFNVCKNHLTLHCDRPYRVHTGVSVQLIITNPSRSYCGLNLVNLPISIALDCPTMGSHGEIPYTFCTLCIESRVLDTIRWKKITFRCKEMLLGIIISRKMCNGSDFAVIALYPSSAMGDLPLQGSYYCPVGPVDKPLQLPRTQRKWTVLFCSGTLENSDIVFSCGQLTSLTIL